MRGALPPSDWAGFLDEIEAWLDRHVEGGDLLYGTGIGGLVALSLRARGSITHTPILLQGPVLWGLRERWFPRLVGDPGFLMSHCLTEPRGASDRWLPYNVPEANMDTRAVLEGGEWVINGRKHFISNGYDASLYVVYANTDPSLVLQARLRRA